MEKMKKFLIVADIHGSMSALERTLDLFRDYGADKLILLGDIFGTDADEMVEKLNRIANKITIVRGNNDWYFEPQFADFEIFNQTYENINGRTAFICHGHKLNDMCLSQYGAQIIFQGHVHRPFIFKEQGVIRICPGSIAVPRGGTERSFAFVDENNIQILNLEGNVIDSTTY